MCIQPEAYRGLYSTSYSDLCSAGLHKEGVLIGLGLLRAVKYKNQVVLSLTQHKRLNKSLPIKSLTNTTHSAPSSHNGKRVGLDHWAALGDRRRAAGSSSSGPP